MSRDGHVSDCIDIEGVCGVLLADGWHEVNDDSFGVGWWAFARFYKPSGDVDKKYWDSGESGFYFEDKDSSRAIEGPMTSVLAVRTWSF